MRSLSHIVLKSFFAVGLLVSLAACDTTTGFDLGTEASVSMKDMSYKAADSLVAQTQKTLPAGTPILIGTLSDVNRMETSTALGRMIAEQVGTRLVQRGFVVSDVRFRNAINVKEDSRKNQAGEYFLSRDTSVLKGEQEVGAVVTGTYVKAKREVLVNLRMIDAATSRVLAATDYRVPANSDVRALTDNSDNAVDANGNPDPYAFDWGW